MDVIKKYRYFLKDTVRKHIDFSTSDQQQGRVMPPLQEEVADDLLRITLPGPNSFSPLLNTTSLFEAMGKRKSRRKYTNQSLSLEELSFLLWGTQGQRKQGGSTPHFRTVPSAGARHSFETYLFIHRVETIPQGLYRYLPLSHELVLLSEFTSGNQIDLSKAVFGQRFVADGAVVFVWTTVPYRMEWRYKEAAHRVILMDVGHVCQNLYLACEAIGAGTCAIAAYDQEGMDSLLEIDGEHQFTLYLAPVGKI